MIAHKLLLGACLLLNVANVASFASMPHRPGVAPITKDEIEAAQNDWAAAIVAISTVHLDGGDIVAAATAQINKLYGYGYTPVMFKPTKAAVDPFRPKFEGALSYFVGGDKVPVGGYAEDKGFALGSNGANPHPTTLTLTLANPNPNPNPHPHPNSHPNRNPHPNPSPNPSPNLT